MAGSHTVYIGIGSNLGDRAGNCSMALEAVSRLHGTRLIAVSSMYETAPVGRTEQPWFINAVAGIETGLGPEELLAEIRRIEDEMGRTRGEKWGSRIIDLDILFYDECAIHTAGLTIPHPEAHIRRFVLLPLLEIEPAFVHPLLKRPCSELLKELDREEQKCIKVSGPLPVS